MSRARAIAFYLPQFHPITENDEWWGKGFTEWTNAAKAKPMFRGHYQPHIPADLGFYDLRVAETREAQANLARGYGIEGFCYYHYWFAGRRILERPFNEVLYSGTPDFPFCLCWANQTWSGIWHGEPHRILIEQTYPGHEDHEAHFHTLLPAFADRRYMRVDGRPLFVIYDAQALPNAAEMLALWRSMAMEAGLGGLYFAGISSRTWNPTDMGFDAGVDHPNLRVRQWVSPRRHPFKWISSKLQLVRAQPTIESYQRFIAQQIAKITSTDEWHPCVTHAWDNTPRSGSNGLVVHGTAPELFRELLDRAVDVLKDRPLDNRLLFLKSWNEWAEGNHLEPDLKFGTAFLEAISDALQS